MVLSESSPTPESPSDFQTVAEAQMQVAESNSTFFPSINFRAQRAHTKELSLDTEYKGTIIPPSSKARHKHRTLVLCFDGTGDQFDNDNSNVVNFFSMLAKGQSKQQLVYYQAGIGTYTIPNIASPWTSKMRKTIDMMFGTSLNHHVMGGYEFLMQNYKRGDRICIFGFSRGAYTARALAGMIEKVGLLPAGNHQQVPFAYKMYMKDDEDGWKQSCLFKKAFSMDVDIEFVGVWDTVDSVGIFPRHVPFTKKNTCVKTFRHAISLDEHRVKFKASLFDKAVTSESQNSDFSYTPFSQHRTNWRKRFSRKNKGAEALERIEKEFEKNPVFLKEINKSVKEDKYNKSSKLQEKYTDKTKKTNVLEVWFSGCHTDVGGGSVPNETRYALARIPLRWMIRQCFLAGSGIQFQADRLHEIGLDPASLYPIVQPRPEPLPVSSVVSKQGLKETKKALKNGSFEHSHVCSECPPLSPVLDSGSDGSGSGYERSISKGINAQTKIAAANEEHEELHDALSPVFDQLALRRGWWILELLPLVHRYELTDGNSVKVVSVNAGRSRKVPQQKRDGIHVHRSVKMRMEAEALALGSVNKYIPRVKFECEPTWVD